MVRNELGHAWCDGISLCEHTYYAEQATGDGSSCYGAQNDQSKKTSRIPTCIPLQKGFYQRRRHLQQETGRLCRCRCRCRRVQGALKQTVHFLSWQRCGCVFSSRNYRTERASSALKTSDSTILRLTAYKAVSAMQAIVTSARIVQHQRPV